MSLKIWKPSFRGYISYSFIILFISLALACKPEVRTRPIGYIKLGPLSKFIDSSETELSQHWLILRYDQGGFSAMSTLDTYKLIPLERKTKAGDEVLASPDAESVYALDGKVLSGPAKANLPYYALELNSGEYGGPKDTLYVKIGVEVEKGWRLKVPG